MRNPQIKQRQRACIVARFLYLTDTRKFRFDTAVQQMSENEFFFAVKTIYDIIRDYQNGKITDAEITEVQNLSLISKDVDFAH